MTTLTLKYRGTREYELVRAELINAARYLGTLTYQEVAVLMGIAPQGAHMARETGQLLGEISEEEHRNGRPMLSAIAVGKSGRPGEGFFGFAKTLRKLKDDSEEGQRRFWETEQAAVYETWQRK